MSKYAGYTSDLSAATGTRPDDQRLLRLARDHIRDCECGREDRQPCHRCLLPFVRSAEHELVSKDTATELLTEILEGWQPQTVDTLADIRIDALADSELERLFVETLRAKAGKAQDDPAARIGSRWCPEPGPAGWNSS